MGPEAGQSSGPDPDGDVIELIATDVGGALCRLMQRHGGAVYRYCRVALHDATLADDVHQQVFLQALRDLPRFAGRSLVRVWLFAIARHRVLDAVKQRRRSQDRFDELDDTEPPDPQRSPLDAIDDARLYEALVACVAELDEPSRTAVLLRYQQGFTFDAMAEICQEKAGTLQARVTRAVQRLRGAIEAHLCRDSSSTARRVTVRSGGTMAPAPVG
jgi:RNA polymerase sigma-70 factor (ECF subfamily)